MNYLCARISEAAAGLGINTLNSSVPQVGLGLSEMATFYLRVDAALENLTWVPLAVALCALLAVVFTATAEQPDTDIQSAAEVLMTAIETARDSATTSEEAKAAADAALADLRAFESLSAEQLKSIERRIAPHSRITLWIGAISLAITVVVAIAPHLT